MFVQDDGNKFKKVKVISKETLKTERVIFINNKGKNIGEIHKEYKYHGKILKTKTVKMVGIENKKNFVKDIVNKILNKKDVVMIEKPNRTIIYTYGVKGK